MKLKFLDSNKLGRIFGVIRREYHKRNLVIFKNILTNFKHKSYCQLSRRVTTKASPLSLLYHLIQRPYQ